MKTTKTHFEIQFQNPATGNWQTYKDYSNYSDLTIAKMHLEELNKIYELSRRILKVYTEQTTDIVY